MIKLPRNPNAEPPMHGEPADDAGDRIGMPSLRERKVVAQIARAVSWTVLHPADVERKHGARGKILFHAPGGDVTLEDHGCNVEVRVVGETDEPADAVWLPIWAFHRFDEPAALVEAARRTHAGLVANDEDLAYADHVHDLATQALRAIEVLMGAEIVARGLDPEDYETLEAMIDMEARAEGRSISIRIDGGDPDLGWFRSSRDAMPNDAPWGHADVADHDIDTAYVPMAACLRYDGDPEEARRFLAGLGHDPERLVAIAIEELLAR